VKVVLYVSKGLARKLEHLKQTQERMKKSREEALASGVCEHDREFLHDFEWVDGLVVTTENLVEFERVEEPQQQDTSS
jgi:hypothetical protein